MWCWLVVTFWSLAYASKQSDEVLNKAKPFKDFGATWNKAWTILVLGLSEIFCACLHLNQHYQGVRERAKNKRVRNWSLSKAVGKAALVKKQLGQLWWKGQCGWEGRSWWAQQGQAGAVRSCSAPSAQAELRVGGSGMVPESSACCSPLLNFLVGKQQRRQNEMLL